MEGVRPRNECMSQSNACSRMARKLAEFKSCGGLSIDAQHAVTQCSVQVKRMMWFFFFARVCRVCLCGSVVVDRACVSELVSGHNQQVPRLGCERECVAGRVR